MHDAAPQAVGFESDQSLMYLAGVDEALQEGSKGRKEAVVDIRKPHRNCQPAFWSDTRYRTLARSKICKQVNFFSGKKLTSLHIFQPR